jgi:hypothetical protein
MEINAVLLEIFSDIQRQLQHGLDSSHVDQRQKKMSQSPPEIQKSVILSGHTGKRILRKVHPRDKGQSLDDSSKTETSDLEGSSSSRTIPHSQRKWKKRKNSKNYNLEEFNKDKPPSFGGEIKRGEEAEA